MEINDKPPLRRRWYQISLRDLIWLTAVVGLLVIAIKDRTYRKIAERRVEQLESQLDLQSKLDEVKSVMEKLKVSASRTKFQQLSTPPSTNTEATKERSLNDVEE